MNTQYASVKISFASNTLFSSFFFIFMFFVLWQRMSITVGGESYRHSGPITLGDCLHSCPHAVEQMPLNISLNILATISAVVQFSSMRRIENNRSEYKKKKNITAKKNENEIEKRCLRGQHGIILTSKARCGGKADSTY